MDRIASRRIIAILQRRGMRLGIALLARCSLILWCSHVRRLHGRVRLLVFWRLHRRHVVLPMRNVALRSWRHLIASWTRHRKVLKLALWRDLRRLVRRSLGWMCGLVSWDWRMRVGRRLLSWRMLR